MKIHVEHDGYYGWVPAKGGVGDTTIEIADAVGEEYLRIMDEFRNMAYQVTLLVEGR